MYMDKKMISRFNQSVLESLDQQRKRNPSRDWPDFQNRVTGVGPKTLPYYAAWFTIGPAPPPKAGDRSSSSASGASPVFIVSDVRRFQPRTIVSKLRREQFGLDERYATAEGLELVYAVASKLSVGELWADSGCRRGVAGSKDHHELKALMAKFGLKPTKEYKTQEFQFGDGKTAVSFVTWVYPVVIQGRYVGDIPLAEVAVPCPALFSKQMLKD